MQHDNIIIRADHCFRRVCPTSRARAPRPQKLSLADSWRPLRERTVTSCTMTSRKKGYAFGASGDKAGLRDLCAREGPATLLKRDECDSEGATAFFYAASRGHLDLCEFLFDCDPEVGSRLAGQADNSGTTPLHTASYNGHLHVVQWLLADPLRCPRRVVQAVTNAEDADPGSSALHYAASEDAAEIAQCLVHACPALLPMRRRDGKTAAEVARATGNVEIAELLKKLEEVQPQMLVMDRPQLVTSATRSSTATPAAAGELGAAIDIIRAHTSSRRLQCRLAVEALFRAKYSLRDATARPAAAPARAPSAVPASASADPAAVPPARATSVVRMHVPLTSAARHLPIRSWATHVTSHHALTAGTSCTAKDKCKASGSTCTSWRAVLSPAYGPGRPRSSATLH